MLKKIKSEFGRKATLGIYLFLIVLIIFISINAVCIYLNKEILFTIQQFLNFSKWILGIITAFVGIEDGIGKLSKNHKERGE